MHKYISFSFHTYYNDIIVKKSSIFYTFKKLFRKLHIILINFPVKQRLPSVCYGYYNNPLHTNRSFPICLSISNSEIIQICFVSILCCQTGVCKIAFLTVPLFQATIIEHLQIIINNERNYIIFQTFFEHDQPSHTTIAISSCQGWDKKNLANYYI